MEELQALFIDLHEFWRDIGFADGQGEHIIRSHFTIIILAKVKIIGNGSVEVKPGMFFRQVKQFPFPFQSFILESISKVGMLPPFLVESFIGSQVESYPETFPGIGRDPVEPGPDLEIADIFVSRSDKIERIGEFLEHRGIG